MKWSRQGLRPAPALPAFHPLPALSLTASLSLSQGGRSQQRLKSGRISAWAGGRNLPGRSSATRMSAKEMATRSLRATGGTPSTGSLGRMHEMKFSSSVSDGWPPCFPLPDSLSPSPASTHAHVSPCCRPFWQP